MKLERLTIEILTGFFVKPLGAEHPRVFNCRLMIADFRLGGIVNLDVAVGVVAVALGDGAVGVEQDGDAPALVMDGNTEVLTQFNGDRRADFGLAGSEEVFGDAR